MKKKKEDKLKIVQTINFDACVLDALRDRCARQGTTISNFVNALCRSHVLTDETFYRELSKFHYLEMQKALFMRDRAIEKKELLREEQALLGGAS